MILTTKLKKINIEEVYQETVNSENENLLEWIKSSSFYSDSYNKIQKQLQRYEISITHIYGVAGVQTLTF